MGDSKQNRLSYEELEELVPELLYGELDDSRAEEVRAQLPEHELDGKVAAYERLREVFLMREFLDMPFKQIAQVVGVPENTVKSRMRYALEKLRLELEEYAGLAKAVQ